MDTFWCLQRICEGNGDTVYSSIGTNATGTRQYYLVPRHISLGCNYPNSSYGGPAVVKSINADSEFQMSANVVTTGETLSVTNNSNYTHYSWDFGEHSNVASSTMKNPPPITFNSFGRDTIALYAQMDENNACHSTTY